MSGVVKRLSKYVGGVALSTIIASRILGPVIFNVQKIKTEEAITDESFLRRFEQALIEGDVRFEEDQAYVFEMMRSFYDIEGLTERLRTCPQYEKKDLWINMKTLIFARLLSSAYLNYIILILSKTQMILISKELYRASDNSTDTVYENCRIFMNEIKGLYTFLTAEICTAMVDTCHDVLDLTTIDAAVQDLDSIKMIFMKLKRRFDSSVSMKKSVESYFSSQIQISNLGKQFLNYCRSQKFVCALDYVICDGLEEISINGLEFIESNNKRKILLSWMMYSSSLFGVPERRLINLPMKVPLCKKHHSIIF